MKSRGWDGDPIDVVRMLDNEFTTMDNTRLASAKTVGIGVKANVHCYSDLLTDVQSKRFTTPKGTPNTWGEAIEFRIRKQNKPFRDKALPYGTYEMPLLK
jgi:hypothetical protein